LGIPNIIYAGGFINLTSVVMREGLKAFMKTKNKETNDRKKQNANKKERLNQKKKNKIYMCLG